MAEFYERLDRESSEFALLDKLKSVFLNGVAYLNKSMSKIVREFVETLFHLELLKVLVVTEEVAINSSFRGKMVIVSSCRKFDGNSYR
jgi:superfamily II RNA helicase